MSIYYCEFGTRESKNLIFDYYYSVYLVIYCDFGTNESKITNFWALYIDMNIGRNTIVIFVHKSRKYLIFGHHYCVNLIYYFKIKKI